MSKKKPRTPVDTLPTGMENADPLYTQEQAAAYLSVPAETLTFWRKTCPELVYMRLGPSPRFVRYRRSALEAFITICTARAKEGE